MRQPDPSSDPREQALLRLLQPLARLALAGGWTLPALVEALKVALATAAADEDPRSSMSQLSVRTGVHRKDLRRIAGRPAPRTARSPVSEAFARWRTDPRFVTARGRPRVLPRLAPPGGGPSFETLAASVTTDVHPRAVLDELQRLGLVEVDAHDRVRLVATAFVPRRDRSQMLGLLAENVGDHLDAAVANLRGDGGRFLEQAMFSDGLSAESAAAFNRATRRVWELASAELMPELQRLFDADRSRGAAGDHRVRLGVYGYVAPDPAAASAPQAPRPPRASGASRTVGPSRTVDPPSTVDISGTSRVLATSGTSRARGTSGTSGIPPRARRRRAFGETG
jgi:hypothetical protein